MENSEMSWLYDTPVHAGLKRPYKCIYCSADMKELVYRDDSLTDLENDPNYISNGRRFVAAMRIVWRCEVCGWWYLEKGYEKINDHVDFYSAYGMLKIFDFKDISAPMDQVRGYLAAKYDARFQVDPILYEETVASVFRDIGYQARVTTRSRDWGVDVYLDGPDGSLIGVQVKRWKHAINVEQVTALTGALVINKCTRGVFVTTSSFRPGAVEAARRSSIQGLPVELVDAKKFYELLRVAQAAVEVQPDDPEMPWNNITPRYFSGIH
jgi:restriction system protein